MTWRQGTRWTSLNSALTSSLSSMEVKRREKTKEAVEREKLKAEQEMADQAIVEAERVKIYGLEQREANTCL